MKKNSTESKLEKQKRLSIIGKRLFNEYISNNNINLQTIRKERKLYNIKKALKDGNDLFFKKLNIINSVFHNYKK